MNRRFTSLIQGATEIDLCLLLDESSWRNGVYTYDHEAKRCITCESVPWPVAWVLGRFNLKHRHVHKPPSAESVRECCVELERKVLWRWHRDTKGFLDGDAPWRMSNMPVAEYPKLPSQELRLWLSNLRQAVMGAFKHVKNMYAQGCGVRNMLGITRLGFKMLRESENCAMPRDKEGLFCTMPTTVPFFCCTKGFLKLLDITKRSIQRNAMSCLHSRDTDPYQGAFQNSSLISLPKPAWLLQLIGRGVVIAGSTVT